MATKKDDRIDKRRVTMKNVTLLANGETATLEATDYVRPDHLDAYVADAKTRWQFVEVSEEPDAGPGGYHGQTAVPASLDLPDAGVVYEATSDDD